MKNDCFANYNKNLCGALKNPICQGPGCGFYKSHKQHVADTEKVNERLLNLELGLRSHIMEKYKIEMRPEKSVS